MDLIEPALLTTFADARVLVTGANGFIAGHLIETLLAADAQLTLVDSGAAETETYAIGRPACCQLEVGTPEFANLLRTAGPFDYIFHLAARAYAAGSVQEPYADFAANLAATFSLLELLRTTRAPGRLIFASSAAVYGNPAVLPIDEATPTVPVSPYGVSKLAAERYVTVYAQLYGLRTDSLRFFSVYGPGQRKQVVFDFFRKLHANPQELTVLGDGSQLRDLVYVGDIVSALLTVAARGQGNGGAYNVATGCGISTADLARAVVAAQRTDARLAFTGQTRQGDPERWVGSAAPLRALGWTPQTTLDAGLQATAAWFNTFYAYERAVGVL